MAGGARQSGAEESTELLGSHGYSAVLTHGRACRRLSALQPRGGRELALYGLRFASNDLSRVADHIDPVVHAVEVLVEKLVKFEKNRDGS